MRRGGAKSFVDDLVLGRGVVLSRAATSLRSIETQPWTRRFVCFLDRQIIPGSQRQALLCLSLSRARARGRGRGKRGSSSSCPAIKAEGGNLPSPAIFFLFFSVFFFFFFFLRLKGETLRKKEQRGSRRE